MKRLTEKFEEIVDEFFAFTGEEKHTKDLIFLLRLAVKERDNEVFGWLYKEDPNPDKAPETKEEIEAANNEKARIAQRMEETI